MTIALHACEEEGKWDKNNLHNTLIQTLFFHVFCGY